MLIGTTIVPILTLTSCSTISQYCPPITTGDETNPFINGFNHSGNDFSLLDPYLQHARDKSGASIDPSIKNYLPSKYLYTSAYDNSFKLAINKFLLAINLLYDFYVIQQHATRREVILLDWQHHLN